jgi:competence CoiA-like predicted nuclease
MRLAHDLGVRDLISRRFERRQLFARDLTLPEASPLLRIERGQALELRPRCKAQELVCPYPGCPDARLTTAAGSKRDHFRHLRRAPDVEHSPESWFHFLGKHLVADWLRSLGAEVEVRLEARLPSLQRPDVLGFLHSGERVAFEIQYAGLTFDDWQRRQQGYVDEGIECVWLFGHLPRYLRRARGEENESLVQLGALQIALENEGRRIHWLFPDEKAIGTRIVEEMTPRWQHDWAEIAVDPLEVCSIENGLFHTPAELRDVSVAQAREQRGERSRMMELRERRVRFAAEKELQERRKQRRAERRAREEEERLARGEEEVEVLEEVVLPPRLNAIITSRRSIPRPDSPLPPLAAPAVDRYSALRVVRQLFGEQRGKKMHIKEWMGLARERGVDVGPFVEAVMQLEREDVVVWSPHSTTGGYVSAR